MHWKQESSQGSNFIKVSPALIVKEGKSVVGKICEECNALSQGWEMEKDGVELDNFSLRSCLFQAVKVFVDCKLRSWVLEVMPVGSEHTVTLLEAQQFMGKVIKGQ